jgi:hypothetical protein
MLFNRAFRTWATLLVLVLILAPYMAFAQGSMPDQIVPCTGTDCTVCDIATLAQRVLNAGIYIAVFMSAILFAWAGVTMVTAGGNPGKVTQAKSIFWNVTVGLVLILAAWLLVDVIFATLTGNHLWNRIC